MIWIAIAIQLILSAGLLWASWQVWMLRHALQETVKTVDDWTEACENALQGSTPSLGSARVGVDATRKQYQLLQAQLEKIRNLLSVVARGVSFVGSRWQQSRRSSSKRSSKGAPSSLNNKSSVSRSSRSKHNVKRRR
jgi:hypothetical protein